MTRIVCHLLWIATLVAVSTAAAQDTSCCTIAGLDVARLCETFDAPLAETKKDMPLAADFGKADPKKPCCTLTTEVGGAGKTLGVRKYETAGVDVILTELKRTSGDTLTARWQYCNGSPQPVTFKPEGCVGMGCTYTPAYGMHLLDGATREKHPMLKDDKG